MYESLVRDQELLKKILQNMVFKKGLIVNQCLIINTLKLK